MSRADNSVGLILASSPMFKKGFWESKCLVVPMTSPLISKRVNFPTIMPKNKVLRTDPAYVKFIEDWARVTVIVPPRMDKYIAVNMEIQGIFQNYGSPDGYFILIQLMKALLT